jgi:hypothetical protein
MIIKGQARGRAAQLAAHLLATDQNESIRLYECRGTLSQDVKGALTEMEARGLAARSKRPLYHASISPEPTAPLSDLQIGRAVDHLEYRLGLQSQPRIVVVHRKQDREHIHVVWSRINAEDGTAISYSWNYRLHERAARKLEAEFGHRPVANSGERKGRRGSSRTIADYELRQEERSGISPGAVIAEVTALWHGSDSGAEFKRSLMEAGYVLARGDRRVFVIIDRTGNVHSLARRIDGVDTRALRERMRDIDLHTLPSVTAVRETQVRTRVVGERRKKFAFAAREVTRSAMRKRTIHQAAREAGPNLVAVSSPIDSPVVQSAVRRRQHATGPSLIYRSARAVLFGDFATRMAAARRYLTGDQLIAALAALEAERNAALDALRATQPWSERRHARSKIPIKRRRLKVRATIRRRMRYREMRELH